MSELPDIAIGIDLGTTNSCAAYYNAEDDRPETLENEIEDKLLPSCVFIKGDERVVGKNALDFLQTSPQHVIIGSKRFIGKKITDATVQEDMRTMSYKLESNGDGIGILIPGEKSMRPESIAAIILEKIKQYSQQKLEGAGLIKKAVITVPAHFNNVQKDATREAGKMAGLDVIHIVSEPTAAAIAYGLKSKCSSQRNILVFDLGGGTYDISIITSQNYYFKVRGTAGDTHLGGENIDAMFAETCCEEFYAKFLKHFPKNGKEYAQLMRNCESGKKGFVQQQSVEIGMNGLGESMTVTVTRSQFEEIMQPFIQKLQDPIDKALRFADLDKEDISTVLLTGGSSRIAPVVEFLKVQFPGKLFMGLNRDEAIAHGAAIVAAKLCGVNTPKLKQFLWADITCFDVRLAVMTHDNKRRVAKIIVKAGTTLPHKSEKPLPFKCKAKKTDQCVFKFFQGPHLEPEKNVLLGEFFVTLEGETNLDGEFNLELILSLDLSGELKLIGKESGSETKKEITVQIKKVGIDPEERNHVLGKMLQWNEIDETKRKEKLKRDNFLDACFTLIRELKLKLCDDAYKSQANLLSDMMKKTEELKSSYFPHCNITELIKSVQQLRKNLNELDKEGLKVSTSGQASSGSSTTGEGAKKKHVHSASTNPQTTDPGQNPPKKKKTN